jgi:multiple antibiotic resistance protein
MEIMQSIVGTFLIAFPALFSIVNPPGGALIYSQVTAERSHPERVRLAWRVALYSAGVMLVALWAGASLIGFFGVTLSALRIAGGLVVASRAWELLASPQDHEGRKQEQAAPAAGADDVAFFPLTMPFTAGPGTIAVAIALGASRPTEAFDLVPFYAGGSLAAVVVAVTVGMFYAAADRVVALLGSAGARVVTRLTAFLLLCIGVQIVLTGVQEAVRPLIAPHP